MIKLSYLLIFALAILFFTSCERGTSDADSVRIRQIANNSDFGNPLYEFEYGNDGMLSRIIELYDDYKCISEILYNSNNQPTSINSMEYIEESIFSTITKTIIWDAKGFTLGEEDSNTKKVYLLDTKERIKSVVELYKNSETQVFDTLGIDYYWTDETHLKISHTYKPPYSSENADWEEDFYFNSGNSPLSGLHIALLVTSTVELAEWVELQNQYCTKRFVDKYLSADITYDFNSNNYPTKADIKYGDGYHDYLYFKYESR